MPQACRFILLLFRLCAFCPKPCLAGPMSASSKTGNSLCKEFSFTWLHGACGPRKAKTFAAKGRVGYGLSGRVQTARYLACAV